MKKKIDDMLKKIQENEVEVETTIANLKKEKDTSIASLKEKLTKC
jgi:hypothetical protein